MTIRGSLRLLPVTVVAAVAMLPLAAGAQTVAPAAPAPTGAPPGPFSTPTLGTAALTADKTQLVGGLRFGSNDLNLGFGARIGHTLPANWYIGGNLEYFLGTSVDVSAGGIRTETSVSLLAVAGEAGYDFQVGAQTVIRPFAGLGIAWARAKGCQTVLDTTTCSSDTEADIAMELGGLFNYLVSPSFLLGGEVRFFVSEETALVFGAHAGLLF